MAARVQNLDLGEDEEVNNDEETETGELTAALTASATSAVVTLAGPTPSTEALPPPSTGVASTVLSTSAAPTSSASTTSQREINLDQCVKQTPDFTMFLRKLENSEDGEQKLSNMSPMLLIEAKPMTFNATRSRNIHELGIEMLSQEARIRAKKTMSVAYDQLADQILACLWERRELKAINLFAICGPFFRRYKVSRPDFSREEDILKKDVKQQLQKNKNNIGTYIREIDGKWTFDSRFAKVWEDVCRDVGILNV